MDASAVISNTISIDTTQQLQSQINIKATSELEVIAPITKDSGIKHQEQDSGEFSHNRYIARQAYINGNNQSQDQNTSSKSSSDKDPVPNDQGVDGEPLTDAEQEQVDKLKKEDSDTKTHERAHQSAGGQYAGSASYDYQRGPDGKNYAIGGHVDIDVSKEDTPEKTLQKMEQVMTAARAPADPSSQDLKVASQAQQKAAQARAEIAKESTGGDEESEDSSQNENSAVAKNGQNDSSDSTQASQSSTSTESVDDSKSLEKLGNQTLIVGPPC